MKQPIFFTFLLLVFNSCLLNPLQAQVYTDYVGAGHLVDISVSSSGTEEDQLPTKTVDGLGIDSAFMKIRASRFLGQASLGANRKLIEQVADLGPEAWIEEQLTVSPGLMQAELNRISRFWEDKCNEFGATDEVCAEIRNPYTFKFQYAWWSAALTAKDKLRQRVAFALSEMFVVSGIGNIEESYAPVLADYYDMLLRKAFGNYGDLLLSITEHPAMGAYLSHFNNPKTNLEENIRPDENYAREVMQLFSIGLFELNKDGTLKLGCK